MIDVTDIETFPTDAKLKAIAGENIILVKENKIISNVCGLLLSAALFFLFKYNKLKKQTDATK